MDTGGTVMAVCAAVAVAVACLLYTTARPQVQRSRPLRRVPTAELHATYPANARENSTGGLHTHDVRAAPMGSATDDDEDAPSTDNDSAAWATPQHTDDEDGDSSVNDYDVTAVAESVADDDVQSSDGTDMPPATGDAAEVDMHHAAQHKQVDDGSQSDEDNEDGDDDDSTRDDAVQRRIQNFVQQAGTGADASYLELPAPRKNLAALQAKARKANAMNAVGMRLAQYEQNDLAEKPEGRVMLQRSLQQELAQRPDRYLRRVAVEPKQKENAQQH